MLKKITYLFLIITFFSCEKKEEDALEKKAQECIISAHKEDIRILHDFLYQAKGSNPRLPINQIIFLNECVNEEVRLLQSDSVIKAKTIQKKYDNYIDSLYKISHLKHSHRELNNTNSIVEIGNVGKNNFCFILSRLIRHKNVLREFVFTYGAMDYDFTRYEFMTFLTEDSLNTKIRLKFNKNLRERFKPKTVLLINVDSNDSIPLTKKKFEFNKIFIETNKLKKGNYVAKVTSVYITEHGIENMGQTLQFPFEIF